MHGVIVEGSSPSKHEIENHSAGPNICHLSIIACVLNYLWSDVVQSTASCVHQVWPLLKLSTEYRESKITNLDLPLFIYQNVLWLQVSV